MQTRIAVVGIIVEDFSATEKVNSLLHDYRKYVVGRMGIPYAKREIGVISVVLDAPNSVISALTGKIGMIQGIKCKTVYSTN